VTSHAESIASSFVRRWQSPARGQEVEVTHRDEGSGTRMGGWVHARLLWGCPARGRAAGRAALQAEGPVPGVGVSLLSRWTLHRGGDAARRASPRRPPGQSGLAWLLRSAPPQMGRTPLLAFLGAVISAAELVFAWPLEMSQLRDTGEDVTGSCATCSQQ
jgi:hypothetical protein